MGGVVLVDGPDGVRHELQGRHGRGAGVVVALSAGALVNKTQPGRSDESGRLLAVSEGGS